MKVVGWGNAELTPHAFSIVGRGRAGVSRERFGSSGNGRILPVTKALEPPRYPSFSRAAVDHGGNVESQAVV